MIFLELIEFFGYFCLIYMLFILFPWVLVIFRTSSPSIEEAAIPEIQEEIIVESFIIKLETSKSLFNPRINPELLEKLSVRGILGIGKLSKIIQEVEEFDKKIDLTNLRQLLSEKKYEELIDAAYARIKLHPKEVEPYIHLIRSNYLMKNFYQCIVICEELLLLDEDNINAIRFIARSYNNLKNHKRSINSYLNILDFFPEDQDAIIMLIRSYFHEEKYEECIETCEKMLLLDDSNIDAIKFIARSNYNLGNKEKTIIKLLEIVSNQKEDIDSRLMLANYYFSEEKYEDTIKWCKEALILDKSNHRAQKLISRSYNYLEDWENAEKSLIIMTELTPVDFDSFILLIRNYYNTKEFERCMEICNKLLKEDGNNLVAEKFINLSREKLGLDDEIVETYLHQASKSNKDVKSRLKLIKLYYNKKQYLDCIKISNEVLSINKNDTYVLNLIGKSHYNLGNNEESLSYLLRLLKFQPDDLNTLMVIIRLYFNTKNYEECIKYCIKSLSIDSSDLVVKRLLTRCYNSVGNEELAEEMLLDIIKQNPKDLESKITLVRNYYTAKKYEKVHEICNQILKQKKSNRMALIFHARAYTASKNFKKALDAWERVLKKNKKDTEALSGAGRACYTNGEIELARGYLERALKVTPDSIQVQRSLSLVYLKQKEWDKAMPILISECRRLPESFINWERRINLLFEMNNEKEAKECLNEIMKYVPDKGDAHFVAFSISKSYYWNDDANYHLEEALSIKNNDAEFIHKFAEYYFDQGILTEALRYILLGEELDISNIKIINTKKKLEKTLHILDVKLEEIKLGLKTNKDILISECAIRKIFSETRKIPRIKVKENMRIAIASSSMNRGGAERQVVSTLEGLSKNKTYKNVKLYCNRIDNSGGKEGSYEEEINELKVSVVEYGKEVNGVSNITNSEELLTPWKEFLDYVTPRMRREIEPMYLHLLKFKPHIVHTWQDTTNICTGLAAAMAGVPKILMFARSLRPDGKTMLHMRNTPFLKEAYRTLLSSNDFTLCLNSKAGAKSYSDWLGLPIDIIQTLYNGTDFNGIESVCINEEIESKLKEFKIPKDAKVVGSVFRFVMEKRPLLWIESAEKVLQKHPETHFVLIGSGGLFDSVSKEINNKELSSRIHLVGQTNLIKLWLDRMDLFLMTSQVEGLPNVLIEAQGFGVPVISTNAGGAKETFVDGETGHLVVNPTSENIANKINEYLSDDDWIKKASFLSKENAREKFDKKIMHANLIKLYQSL